MPTARHTQHTAATHRDTQHDTTRHADRSTAAGSAGVGARVGRIDRIGARLRTRRERRQRRQRRRGQLRHFEVDGGRPRVERRRVRRVDVVEADRVPVAAAARVVQPHVFLRQLGGEDEERRVVDRVAGHAEELEEVREQAAVEARCVRAVRLLHDPGVPRQVDALVRRLWQQRDTGGETQAVVRHRR